MSNLKIFNQFNNFEWKSGQFFECKHSIAGSLLGIVFTHIPPAQISPSWISYNHGLIIALSWVNLKFKPWHINYNLSHINKWMLLNNISSERYEQWLKQNAYCWHLIDENFYNITDLGSFSSHCQINFKKNIFNWKHNIVKS